MKKTISIALMAPMALALFSAVALAQSESRDDVLKQIETKRAELAALEKSFLSPSAEDREAYAEFLRQPDTGLIRLLPRDVYGQNDSKHIKSITLNGGGAYYSFARLTHEYGQGSDIALGSGYLSVGFAGADYGMLTSVGDLSIEEITIEHPSVQFMAGYVVPGEEPKARLEYRRFATGETVGDRQYQTRVPVAVGSTYLLRSISFERSDVLVALRVVRKDSDGSVIIVWKLLKKYSKPELARNTTPQ